MAEEMAKQIDVGVDIALIHYPVLGKQGEIIGAAITNLDLHDIARTGRTYGIGNYYIVTPYAEQQTLVREIIEHWQTGHGSQANPARKEAFSIVRLAASLDEVIAKTKKVYDVQPLIMTTSAHEQAGEINYRAARKKIAEADRTLLLFGTAHGLAPEILERADYALPAILGGTAYNHLSVRAAVAIVCDRLVARNDT